MASTNKTALVLCGGGSQGAAEVGLYQALLELNVHPDCILGSSVVSYKWSLYCIGHITRPA